MILTVKKRKIGKGNLYLTPVGYLVERWVRRCAAQIGCFFQVYQWPLFYLKIGLDIGNIFAKYIIFNELFLYRLSKSTHACQFTWLKSTNWF